MSVEADPINSDNLNRDINKFIPKKFLEESNYYKDLLIEIKEFEKIINDC